jgi:hypothetical protein
LWKEIAQRPLIQIISAKEMEQKWLFDTVAGLTCMSLKAFRMIDRSYRPPKIQ